VASKNYVLKNSHDMGRIEAFNIGAVVQQAANVSFEIIDSKGFISLHRCLVSSTYKIIQL
jgi:hypothetical protein